MGRIATLMAGKYKRLLIALVFIVPVVIVTLSIVIPKIQQAGRDKEAARQQEESEIARQKNEQYQKDTAQRIASDMYDTDLRSVASEFAVTVDAQDCITETVYFESTGRYSLCAYSDEKYDELLALGETVSRKFTEFIRAKYDQSGDVDVCVLFMGNFIFLNGELDTAKTAQYYDVNRQP